MTDSSTRPANVIDRAGESDSAAEPVDAGQRGSLDVAERAVERIATLAAGEVAGVQRTGSGLDSVLGRQYPKADASVAGGHVKVSIDLAVAWPNPLATTAKAVRDRVRHQLEHLSGLSVDRVDVTIAQVNQPETKQERRVT